jgi:hypothetical protein
LVCERQANLVTKTEEQADRVCYIVGPEPVNNPFEFVVDLGCYDHMVYEPTMLKKREEFVRKVTVASRESMTTTHRGTLVVSDKSAVEIELNNVLDIPEIKCNLLSVRSLASNEVSVCLKETQ